MEDEDKVPARFPYHVPRAVQHAFNYDDAAVSVTDSMSCDTSSIQESVFSYHSTRDISLFIREVSGRKFNSQNTTYFLPSDDIEYNRLDKQHFLNRLSLGSLCPRPELVREVLKPEPDVPKSILDLGCGTGVWAMSMAREFPHCKVVGVDLAPSPITDVPTNCSFELDDINHGLSHWYNQFDVVHSRSIASGLYNFLATADEMIRCVKPGGVLIIVEASMDMPIENQREIQIARSATHPEGSAMQKFLHEVKAGMLARGADLNNYSDFVELGLWDRPEFDPTSCETGDLFFPLGPWPETTNPDEHQRLAVVGTLMRQNIREWVRATKALNEEMGVPQDVVERWIREADESLDRMDGQTWIRYNFCYGRRRLEDGSVAPFVPREAGRNPIISPPPPDSTTPHDEASRAPWPASPPSPFKYSQVHIYTTKEQAAGWNAWRKKEILRLQSIGTYPRPESLDYLEARTGVSLGGMNEFNHSLPTQNTSELEHATMALDPRAE